MQKELAQMFARHILRQEIELDAETMPTFKLEQLKDPAFRFCIEPADGIKAIRMRSMRLAVPDGEGGNLTFTVDGRRKEANLHVLVARGLNREELPLDCLKVDSVTLQAVMTTGSPRPKTVTFTMQQWEVNFPGLAELLKGAFALAGGVQELKPGRAWLIGQRRLGSRAAEFFLIQGAGWPEGLEIRHLTARFANSPAPVVLFPDALPKDPAWQANGRALYSLKELVRLGDSGLVAAIETVEDLYRQIAARREQEIVPTPPQKRPGVLKKCLADYGCKLKDICWWGMVQRQDLNAWKLGKPQVPDGGEKANRIKRFVQLGVKGRA